MKTILSSLIFLTFLFSSCSKKDSTSQTLNVSLLNKKWFTQGSTNLKVIWVEFLYGKTYLLKTQTNVLKRGTYTISPDNTQIFLNNYAVFNIVNLTSTTFNFTATANNSTLQDVISSTAGTVVVNSTNTSGITGNAWNMYKEIRYNTGIPTSFFYPQTYQSSVGTIHIDAIFSPNFTYFVTTVDRNSLGLYDTSYLTRNWLWTDPTETKIKYYGNIDSGFVYIKRLTIDSLDMKEYFPQQNNDSVYYYLKKL